MAVQMYSTWAYTAAAGGYPTNTLPAPNINAHLVQYFLGASGLYSSAIAHAWRCRWAAHHRRELELSCWGRHVQNRKIDITIPNCSIYVVWERTMAVQVGSSMAPMASHHRTLTYDAQQMRKNTA